MSNDLTALANIISNYIAGFHESDAEKLAAVFHPTARLFVVRDGELQSVSIDDYLALVRQRAPVNVEDRRQAVHSVSFVGETAAVARLSVGNGKSLFEDALTLVKEASGWRIAVKAYHATQLLN